MDKKTRQKIKLDSISMNTDNYCIKGKCSRCGQCCSTLIPITNKELEAIKWYMKENNLQIQDNFRDGNNIYDTCPLYDRVNKKCIVYPVRPRICRTFKCDGDLDLLLVQRENAHRRAHYNKGRNGNITNVYTLQELLTGNPMSTLIFLIDAAKTKERLFKLLHELHREDLVKAIENGEIILEEGD